jgi:histidinol dehydrogenase
MSDSLISVLNTADAAFADQLAVLRSVQSESAAEVLPKVQGIIDAIRADGDAALLNYTQQFDRFPAQAIGDLEVPAERCQEALAALPAEQREALEFAAERLREYAQHQKIKGWDYQDQFGNQLGQQVTPLDRVGIYVPGGKAAYPSSVLMNAIPAHVAGVEEIIMVSPAPGGEANELLLAAAAVAGVSRVFLVGGAQAVAALAYGTETVPAVDKIVGPGNIWVATAKRLVFGTVGIDMIAGPSEVLVIADGSGDPDWTAMDLFAQAEHDELAQSILLCPDADYIAAVEASIAKLLPTMERKDIIAVSLKDRGALIQVADLDEAAAISNDIAPEHLELAVADPEALVAKIKHAGAIFMGHHTAEVLGDYCAGPNHVLPTMRTARFSSPLGVYDFQKRSTLIHCQPEGAREIAKRASILARGEQLTAHARSAEYRRDAE